MASCILCVLYLASISGGPVSVFLGPTSERSVAIPRPDAESAVDLAHDSTTGTLYSLHRNPGDYRVREWTPQGRVAAEWTISSDYDFVSILFKRSGNLMLLVRKDGPTNLSEIVLLKSPSGKVEVRPRRGWIADYDKDLDPEAHRRTIELLSILEGMARPIPHTTGDVLGVERPLDPYLVNARGIQDDCVAWTTDLKTVAYAPRTLSAAAILSRGGGSERGWVRWQSVVTELDTRSARPELLTIAVSRNTTAFGLRIGEGPSATFETAWMSLTKDAWTVAKRRPGLLARELRHYRPLFSTAIKVGSGDHSKASSLRSRVARPDGDWAAGVRRGRR